ncbi:hypothetical protein HMPREF9597_00344 [Cutibacterium acnes HL005PA4]|nr:hypothetical protein HMPREF9574_01927 [Cutibacterium acnes HL074PA1]EFS48259.1 hypothetical protein HMPREF9585_01593 [Cutibacterium acnes HL083PA1]EFS54692.1 hypothetical protein HMPREF9589_00198 [Cutibacterium acnes HL059PA1]EFS55823.1 hypothetical protein HMPREF9593_01622 [Cutibacterium acnes HL046PA2]EFS67494.1 hypothetical protein HMPREF9612_00090 [Cutibacterium acnes HL063PA2]EFS80372.1 hypothetical protein HMPREF9597_00344 [Cutibacterium acnes HL005PA4]EFS90825.1 hypothetical protein
MIMAKIGRRGGHTRPDMWGSVTNIRANTSPVHEQQCSPDSK